MAAAREERFSRKKHDPSFPKNAVKYCLDEAAILTVDGVGEWVTASYGYGRGNEIALLKERFPKRF